MTGDLDGRGDHDRTVVVTGGSPGMAEAAALILGDLGARRLHIVDIQQPKTSHAEFYQCDLSDFEQVRAPAEALSAIEPIHFLFPCAGLPPHIRGALHCMKVNYIGIRHLVERLLRRLQMERGSRLSPWTPPWDGKPIWRRAWKC